MVLWHVKRWCSQCFAIIHIPLLACWQPFHKISIEKIYRCVLIPTHYDISINYPNAQCATRWIWDTNNAKNIISRFNGIQNSGVFVHDPFAIHVLYRAKISPSVTTEADIFISWNILWYNPCWYDVLGICNYSSLVFVLSVFISFSNPRSLYSIAVYAVQRTYLGMIVVWSYLLHKFHIIIISDARGNDGHFETKVWNVFYSVNIFNLFGNVIGMCSYVSYFTHRLSWWVDTWIDIVQVL